MARVSRDIQALIDGMLPESGLISNVSVEYARLYGSIDNIRVLWDLATEEQVRSGCGWYAFARASILDVADGLDLPPITFAGVVAAMSPMREWKSNIRDAETVVMAYRNHVEVGSPVQAWSKRHDRGLQGLAAGYDPVQKAYDILFGGSPDLVLSGPKVRAFFQNLIGNEMTVTVDSHAMHAWLGNFEYGTGANGVVHAGSLQFSGSVYDACASDYVTLAAEQGVTPAQAQAVVWLVRKYVVANPEGGK